MFQNPFELYLTRKGKHKLLYHSFHRLKLVYLNLSCACNVKDVIFNLESNTNVVPYFFKYFKAFFICTTYSSTSKQSSFNKSCCFVIMDIKKCISVYFFYLQILHLLPDLQAYHSYHLI